LFYIVYVIIVKHYYIVHVFKVFFYFEVVEVESANTFVSYEF